MSMMFKNIGSSRSKQERIKSENLQQQLNAMQELMMEMMLKQDEPKASKGKEAKK